MTRQRVANLMLQDIPWDGTELASPLTLPGALLAPSFVQQAQISTPSNPAAGYMKLYPKPDGQYYKLDSAGVESIVGGLTQAQADARYPLKTDLDPYPTYLTQAEADARYLTTGGGASTYLPLTGGTLTGNLLFSPDTTYNIGASGATRPAYIYVANAVIAGANKAASAPQIRFEGSSNTGLYSPTANEVGISSGGSARLLVQFSNTTLYNNLMFSPDNTVDIGANGATRPRKIWTNTLEVADSGADTPSLINRGMTAFGGRINIGGTGGADRIGWMLTGINTPNTSIMNGSTQVLWYAEYWSNDAATGDTRGMDFGIIGPPSVKPTAMQVLRIRGVGARAQGPNYATGIRIEQINNGTLENWGLDIAAPGTSASTSYGIRNEGKAWFKGQIDIGTDGTAANRPVLKQTANSSQIVSLESPALYAQVAGKAGTILGGNAYYDGTNWQRYDISAGASSFNAGNLGATILIAPSGANPVTWTEALQVDLSGNTNIRKSLNVGGTNVSPIAVLTSFAASLTGVRLTTKSGPAWMNGYSQASLSANAWHDGTSWNRMGSGTAMNLDLGASNVVLYFAATNSAAVAPAWGQIMVIDSVGTMTLQGDINLPNANRGVSFVDANTRISVDPSRVTCFDGWANWYWRDTSAGLATAMSLDGSYLTINSRTLQLNGSSNMTGNLSVSGQVAGSSLSISGGSSISGRANFFGPSTTGIATAAASQGSIEVQPSGGGASMICFHRPGSFATYFGVDTDSIFRVGGWSMGAAAYRLILGDNYPSNPSLGINGANVGSNSVLFSCHANLYGGVYYSTSSQFLGWPSEGRFKARQASLPNPLALLDRAAISYRQPRVKWHEGEALVSQDENGALSWGFRAEDWRDIPELVQSGPAGIDSFNLTGMIPLTWEATRALYAENKVLKAKYEALESRLATIERKRETV